jgi:hypothetical protein
MTTYGATICGRNDNYGHFLVERATYCLASMLESFDQVIYVDWGTPSYKPTLIEDNVLEGLPKTSDLSKLSWIRITQEQSKEWTHGDPEAQSCVEVMARNIGLRRLTTDYLCSTNIDIICPQRKHFSKFNDENVFYTAGKRSISMFELWEFGLPYEIEMYIPILEGIETIKSQQPKISILPGDSASVVSGCGDWQIAHRNIWYAIRGFEESLYKRGFADSNVQRKAQVAGYPVKVDWSVPVWHIGHTGGMGGKGGMNDAHTAVFMNETSNPETWGFSEENLVVHHA